MQLRTGLMATVLVLAASMVSIALAGGGITTDTHYLIDDSTKTTTFWVGSSAARADFDTSAVYDIRFWDDVTVGVKSRPIATVGVADSGAVTAVFQMSNDSLYWTPIDSIVVADSLPAFKDFTPQKYRWGRFVLHHGTKSDSAGVKVQVKLHNWGRN